MVLKANDRRTSCPCHDEFRGPRSDYTMNFVGLVLTTSDRNTRTIDRESRNLKKYSRLRTNNPLSHKDRSPGRTSSQYLSPYPRSWQPSKKSLSPKRYSTMEHATSQQHSTDRSSRYTDYHSPSTYGWSKDMRRSLSPCYGDYSYLHGRDRSPGHRSQKPRVFLPSRNTVWTDLSLRFPKTLRYSGKVGDGYRRSDVTYNGTSATTPVDSLVVRAPDSGPEGMGPMLVPPNTLQVHTEYVLVKSVGPKVLRAESRVQGTGENFPPLSVPCLNCGGGNRW
ncbi:uncharacterized protein TNCV_2688241 [Trichonephila clavipes]|nr:uncharacterized protein TNCV_2688241 [Trichonephila clavipes]